MPMPLTPGVITRSKNRRAILAVIAALIATTSSFAADAGAQTVSSVFGAPIEFILFGATLLGVAVFHHHTLRVALSGLAAILA